MFLSNHASPPAIETIPYTTPAPATQGVNATPPKNIVAAPPTITNPSAIVDEFALPVVKSYPIKAIPNTLDVFPKTFAPFIQVETVGCRFVAVSNPV